MSSGLGTSNAKQVDLTLRSGELGGFTRFRLHCSKSWPSVDLLRESDASYISTRSSSSLPYLGDLQFLSLSSQVVRGSLRSKEAKAEGNARERVELGRKSGDGDATELSPSVTLEVDGDLACAFFTLSANFEDRFSAPGIWTNGTGSRGCAVDRLSRDW